MDTLQGTGTAALATAVATAPGAFEWKQLGFAVLSAVVVAALNTFLSWLKSGSSSSPDLPSL